MRLTTQEDDSMLLSVLSDVANCVLSCNRLPVSMAQSRSAMLKWIDDVVAVLGRSPPSGHEVSQPTLELRFSLGLYQ